MTLKREWLLTVLALWMVTGLLSPGVAWGGVWAGVQGGWTYMASSNIDERGDYDFQKTYENVKFDSGFFGGVTVGYDFVREGALGRAWPGWMKHVSLVLDATYENVRFQRQAVTVAVKGNYVDHPHYESGISPGGSISMIHITPMLVGRYGVFTSAEVPSGRVQPFLGVGAGVVISNLDLDNMDNQEKNKVDMSVLFEGGLRFMLLRNVSIDAAVRYRLIPTQFGTTAFHSGEYRKINIDIDNPRFINALLRLSYHF